MLEIFLPLYKLLKQQQQELVSLSSRAKSSDPLKVEQTPDETKQIQGHTDAR